jgi:hypothetical protein
MENAAVVCGTQNRSEYEKRIYAYMEKTPRDTKLCISQLIIMQTFYLFRYLQYMGWIKLKTISDYRPFK